LYSGAVFRQAKALRAKTDDTERIPTVVKSMARCLLAAIWLAAWVVACAPRPSIPLPQPAPPIGMPETGDRQAYRIAEDLATARSARAPEAFESFLAKFPDSLLAPQALMRLGELYRDRGDLDAAGDAYIRLLTDHRRHSLAPRALVALVAIDHQRNDFKALLVHSQVLPPNRLEPADRLEIQRLRIEALLALERPLEAAEEAIAAWQAAPDDEGRATLADQLARAVGLLSSQEVSRLADRPMTPEARTLLQRLAKDIAFDRYTIGCMLPLSGSHGVYGQRALRGAEMALMHFTNHPSAPKVRMVIEDTRSRADQAEAIVRGFSQRHVAAILGPMATAPEAAAEAQRQSMPIITFTQREDIPTLGDWVLRYFITPRNQVDALVRWAMERDGIQRFTVLYPADRYGETFMARFVEAVEAYGGTLAGTVSYDPAVTDFAEPIRRLADMGIGSRHGADALFIPDAPAKAALILPQLAFHDLTGLRLLGVNLWHDRSLIEMADTFAEGVIFPTGFFPEQTDGPTATFIEDFEAAYGHAPGYIEAAAYDAAMILLEALGQPEVRSRARLLDFLKDRRPHAGLTGDAFFDSRGELCQSLPLVTVRGGEFVLLDRLPLRSFSPGAP
jgi:ABC-type branched-subunit amino acid transport system substrate-binding protein